MSFLPQLFLSNIKKKGGPARPSRFELILPIPSYIGRSIGNSVIERILNFPNSIFNDITSVINNAISTSDTPQSANPAISRYLALQCEATELPGKTLVTQDAKVYGPTFKIPYQTQYGEITFTFVCTNEFYERKLFDTWINAIMPTDTNNLRYPRGNNNLNTYYTNVTILQYDDFIRQIYGIRLIDAFPIGIASQPLSWAEEGFHRLSIQFAYQKFETIPNAEYNIGQAATTLLGNDSARRFLPGLVRGVTGSISNFLPF